MDMIIDVNDRQSLDTLAKKIAKLAPGEKLTVTFQNKGSGKPALKEIENKLTEKRQEEERKAEGEDMPPDVPSWT